MALVTSLYYGGTHEVALLLAAALVMLGLVMARSAYGRSAAALGLVAGVSQIATSYPWLIGPDLLLISQTLLAGWLALIGSRLLRRRGFAGGPGEAATPIDLVPTQLGSTDGNSVSVSRRPDGQKT